MLEISRMASSALRGFRTRRGVGDDRVELQEILRKNARREEAFPNLVHEAPRSLAVGILFHHAMHEDVSIDSDHGRFLSS
jgi:hypothetical protein